NSPESQALGTSEAIVVALSKSQQAAVLLSPRMSSLSPSGTLAEIPLGGGGARELATRIRSADFMADGRLAALEYTGDAYRVHLPVGNVIFESKAVGAYALRASRHADRIALGTNSGILIIDSSGKDVARIADQNIT